MLPQIGWAGTAAGTEKARSTGFTYFFCMCRLQAGEQGRQTFKFQQLEDKQAGGRCDVCC